MRIKSFFAATVEMALEEARRELGPEAMLIQSRAAPPEARSLGAYEVVCALLPAGAEEKTHRSAPPEKHSNAGGGAAADFERLTIEIDSLRGTVDRLQSTLARTQRAISPSAVDPAFERVWETLLEGETDPALARELIERAAQQARSVATVEDAAALVRRQIEAVVPVDGSAARVLAVVGPPGAGKTACVARVAARFGIGTGRVTHIIALDDHRVAACEQLRAYAAILGAGFSAVEDLKHLEHVLDDCRWKDLILIDTPGFSAAEEDVCRAFAGQLAAHESIDTHLVLPCGMRPADLRRVSDFYAPFEAKRLIFTRLDETRAYGNMLSECVRLGKPLSFLTNGPLIPDDIEVASGGRIADLLLTVSPTSLAAAAGS